jgi:hypothetical protein
MDFKAFLEKPRIPEEVINKLAVFGIVVNKEENTFVVGLSKHITAEQHAMSAKIDQNGVYECFSFIEDIAGQRHSICCIEHSFLNHIKNFGINEQGKNIIPDKSNHLDTLSINILPFYDGVASAYYEYFYDKVGTIEKHSICLGDIALNRDLYLYLTLFGVPHSLQDIVNFLKGEGIFDGVGCGNELFFLKKNDTLKSKTKLENLAAEYLSKVLSLSNLPEPLCLKLTLLYICKKFNLSLAYDPYFGKP